MQIHVLPDPSDAGRHVRYVDRAIAEIARSGLTYEVGALGTTVEGPADAVWTRPTRPRRDEGETTRRVMTLIRSTSSRR